MDLIWSLLPIFKSILSLIFFFNFEKKLFFEKFLIIKNEIDAAAEVAIVEIIVPNIAPHIIPDTNKKNIAIGINITIPKINKKQKIRIER